MSILGTSSQTPRFSPDTLPGVALWLDAADRDSVVLSGSNVARWLDKSGNGNHASGGVSPAFSNAGIVFNGTTTYLSTPYTSFPAVETVVVVATATPPSNAHNCILGAGVTGGRSYSVLRYPGGVEVRWDKYAVNSYSPTVVAVNTRFLTTGIFTGSGGTTSVNGGAQAGTDSFSFSGTGGTNIGATFENGYFNGTINEILVYTAVLSTAQRQQVEGYLARKWGISELIGHPYRIGGSGILPTQISGCTLWLDAADATTFTLSGSNVTAWADKSGNGYTLTQSTTGYYPTRISNTVSFQSNQYLNIPMAAINNASTYDMFFVLTPISTTNWIMVKQHNGTNTYNALSMTNFANTTKQTGTSGYLYWHTVNSGTVFNSSNALSTNTPQIVGLHHDGTTLRIHQNGTTLSITTAGAAIPNATSTTNFLLGAWSNDSSPPSGFADSNVTNFQLGELLFYSTGMSASQRQQVEGYLANKWGLSTALPGPTTSTPYAGALLPMRPLSPLDIDGLSMWLDAADATTVTLSGSNVTAWADKSGRGYSLTVPSGGYTSPTYSNGVVTTTGSNALWSTSNFEISGNTPVTLFLVGSITSSADLGPGATLGLAVGDAGNRQSFGVITYQDSTRTFLFAPTTIEPDSYVILTPNISGQRYVLCGFYTGSAVQGTYNGTLMSSQSTTLNLASRPFQIGMRNANTGTSSAGTICECICYTGALSTTQRQQVETYLADKWGLRARMGGVPHPYRYGPPVIGTPATFLPNLRLWLDAQDSNAYTLSGSNVTAVVDKSSNAWALGTASGATMNATRFNGTYPSFYIGSAGTLASNASFTTSQPFTVYFVGQVLNTFGSSFLLDCANQATRTVIRGGAAMLAGGTELTPTNNTDALSPHVFAATFNGSSSSMVLNGTTTTGNPGTTGYTGFGITVATYDYRGHICELLIYTGTHTTAQVQAMMGYLAWKWGIQSNLLSSSASWLQMKRALTPAFTPTQIPGCVFWIDAADAASMTLSGSNVTQWRDKSSNGVAGTAVASPVLTTVDGVPAVTFNGTSQYIDFGTAGNLGSNQFHIFTVSKFNTTADGSILARVANGDQYYRYTMLRAGGVMYLATQADTGGYGSNASFSDTNTSRRLLSFSWDRSTITGFQNGTLVGSGSYARTATYTSSFKLLVAGYNNSTGGTPPTDGFYMNGSINEILFYFGPLSTAQRQRVEGYLAEKWGLRGSLGGLNHPHRFGPPVILPSQISGCTLWLDAADATTLTLSGSNITQWRDKSGLSNHTSSVVGTPTWSSNQVTLNGSSVLVGPYVNTTTTLTAFVIASVNLTGSSSGGGVWRLLSLGTSNAYDFNSAASVAVILRDGGTSNIGGFRNNVATYAGVQTNTQFLFTQQYTGTTAQAYFNGTTGSSGNSSGSFNTTRYAVGRDAMDGAPYPSYWVGTISEVLLYNAVLSTAERQQLEGYLAWKWGLQTNLPSSTHPYRTIKP